MPDSARGRYKLEDIDALIPVGGSTRMPAFRSLAEEAFQKPVSRGVDPDEAVALGAAIEGGILAGDAGLDLAVLLDVTPFSLGIETLGGAMTRLVERNTTIAHQKKEVFSTARDNQPAVDIHVLQGERPLAADNRTLGRFQLAGIPPAPRGTPQIEVTFDIDFDGVLIVSAKNLGTGKEQSVVVKSAAALSREQVEQSTRRSEQCADERRKKRELIEERNRAEQTAYAARRTLEELADKVGEDDKKAVEEACDRLEEIAKAGDLNRMRRAAKPRAAQVDATAQEAAGAQANDQDIDDSGHEAPHG